MIRNDVLHWFFLGFGLESPDGRDIGRSTNITQLWLNAKDKCFDCETKEVLDALYTLLREQAELVKFVPVGGGFQSVSFERVRNTSGWTDFLMTGYFNIKVLPEGRVHFQRLTEQLRREIPLTGETKMTPNLAAFQMNTKEDKKGKGRWVWRPADSSAGG